MTKTTLTEKTRAFESIRIAANELCGGMAALEMDIVLEFRTPEDIVDKLYRMIRNSYIKCSQAAEKAGSGITEMEEYFRRRVMPWFIQSWFMKRMLEKSGGYTGDYDLLEGIYKMRPRSSGFGRALDLCFLQGPIARAVTGRKDNYREIFKERVPRNRNTSYRVLDIASGPFLELHKNVRGKGIPGFMFTVIDNDQKTLDHAKRSLLNEGHNAENIEFLKYSVLKLTAGKKNIETFGRFDLIYSIDRYDYLPDSVLTKVLRGTAAMLNDNGVYIVAFKVCEGRKKYEDQWILDRHLFPRTEEDCRKIIHKSGMKISGTGRDGSGMIVFYTLEKK